MSEELQKPPVIDLDAFMQPIDGENPSGENQRYSGVYDEIAEARRADDPYSAGDWQSDLKVADYKKVIQAATETLTARSKDLQIAAWFTEALTKEYGFAGFRDGLKLLAGLQSNFWETLHPEIDEGDMEGRANAISWVDSQVSLALKMVPITAGEGKSFSDWEDSQRFTFPDDLASLPYEEQQKFNALKDQAEKENRTTADGWKRARAATRRQFCEETSFTITEIWTAYNELNLVIEEKYDRNQMPGMSEIKKSLESIEEQTKKLLDEKRAEEPDPKDFETESDGEVGDSAEAGTSSGGGGSMSAGGAINNRKEALRRLGEIAVFFHKTEPHSPVSYLVQRAVKWGNMPLESWLQEVIKDDGVLSKLRETLGIQAGAATSFGAEPSSSTESFEEPTPPPPAADNGW